MVHVNHQHPSYIWLDLITEVRGYALWLFQGKSGIKTLTNYTQRD